METCYEACKLCKETSEANFLEKHTIYSNMASRQPKLIVLFSGKRKTGKDYITDHLYDRLDKEKEIVIIKLSAPLKKEFAVQSNLDYERLLQSINYKEKYRPEMISFGEMKRKEDPGFFIRAAIKMFNAVNYPVWIVSDMRRKSDLDWFKEYYPHVLYTVRIESTEEFRKLRGYIFKKGVDDEESECSLDDYTDWDMKIHNSGSNLPVVLPDEWPHLLEDCCSTHPSNHIYPRNLGATVSAGVSILAVQKQREAEVYC
ncbi:hypothetical protein Pmani_023691 [Petrolisthes manimaculis]|uniref:Phosphomevalonate kinase n=1 Tax=Petrolisthes manimaculis TaxID=1843537 RepID=A0AAE1P9J1_9EUCA|nr:hypothetical protein Pmani_023691 [Petrolisthes manimaculis]